MKDLALFAGINDRLSPRPVIRPSIIPIVLASIQLTTVQRIGPCYKSVTAQWVTMLATDLFTRALGQTSPFSLAQDQTTRLLHAIQPAPHVRFEGHSPKASVRARIQDEGDEASAIAHTAGVNAIVIDKFEGR